MKRIPSTQARMNFAEIVRDARDTPIIIEKHGEREAVLISPALFDRLMAAEEELDDIAAFDEAMAEEGENIPWDEVKAELGWV